jgi:hypothetical protein
MQTDLISENAVRAGLSQGALSSPIVAGLIMKPCLDKVSATLCCTFLDNVTVGDTTVEKVEAQLDTLAEALLSQHSGSPLFEKVRHAFKIGKHADILGYWPRPNPANFSGGLRFSPSNTAIRRFYCRLMDVLLKLPDQHWDKLIEGKAYAFAASQKNWGGKIAGREFLITAFAASIVPLFDGAHKEVQQAIGDGKPANVIKNLVHGHLKKLMPAAVLANQNGLQDWSDC